MFLEGKKKKHSFVTRSGSLENICIRTCGSLCKWQRGWELQRHPAPGALPVSSTQPEDNLVIYRNAFGLSYPDCSFNRLFRKDLSLTLSVAPCLSGPAACV